MQKNLLIYGATGYTGRLIAAEAVGRGLRPVLAGRNAEPLAALANELGCDYRAVGLDDPKALDAALDGVRVVLHCAGPFSQTSRPMAEACLRTGTHYLDITGEIATFEALARRGSEARARKIMLLPGVGFDVVPTDCLAAYLARRLPDATHLTLAFRALGSLSRGTATTMIEGLGRSGAIRREGKITPVPAAYRVRSFDFGRGPVKTVTFPWGDVSTAFYSTGIPNIEVYIAVPTSTISLMQLSRPFGWFAGSPPVRALLTALVRRQPPGPDEAARKRGLSLIYGEANNAAGQVVRARMTTPEGYSFTALAAVACAERALNGDYSPGFQTPSLAYGPDFVLGIAGVTRTDD
jgi:short subunit dehydrogenase-like uncharacterized protein